MVAKRSRIIDFLTVVLYASLFMISSESFNGQIISLGAAIISVLIVVAAAIINNGKIQIQVTPLHAWLLTFIVFCYISSLWALQPGLAISKGNTIVKNSICIVLIYLYYQHSDNIKDLLKVVMYGGYIIVLSSVVFLGVSSLTDVLGSSGRMEASFLNQNTLGMLAAFTIIINVYFIIYYKEQIALAPVLVLSVVVLAAAGSRKGIIELVAGVIVLFIVRNYHRRRFIKSILKIIVVIMSALIVIYFVSLLPMFDFINMRLENIVHLISGSGTTDRSIRSRAMLNQLGLQIFKDNPILGIGIDCPRIPAKQLTGVDWYLHNNYLELLAGGGVVGFLCFYSIFILLIYRFVKYRSERSPEYDVCLVLMILQAMLEFAYVAYYSRETYFYLMLYFVESNILKYQAENRKSIEVKTVIYGDE